MSNIVFVDTIGARAPSPKKGIANTGVTNYGTMTPLSAASQGIAVTQLGVSWYYNYGPTPGSRARYTIPLTDPGPTVITPGVKFVPMILDQAHANPTELGWAQPYALEAGAILGPNEPYGEGAMSVSDAVALYGTLNSMFPPSSGVLIGSPAGFGAAPALAWFNSFFAQCAANGYRVDFFAHHWSAGYTAGVAPSTLFTPFALGLDQSIAAYGLPVWCTENEVYSPTDDTVPPITWMQSFWNLWVPYVNNYSKVQRWSWWPLGPNPFTGNIGAISYCNFDGSLTVTGRAYSFL